MGSLAAAAKIGGMILLAQCGAAIAGEVKVMAGAALSGVIEELGPQFQSKTGHKLVIQFGLSGTFKKQIEAGEAFDVAIIAPAQMEI